MYAVEEIRYMEQLRVMFIGTPVFACSVLQALKEEGYNVVAVVSQPDKPVGRKQIIEKTPVHALADSYGIPVLQPEKLKESVAKVLAYLPDLIVTCAYGQIVPEELLNYPKYGCINVHPSLLPKYRGGAPVHRAIWNGDTKTGVCLMEMVKAMDAGKVYACLEVPIEETDTTESLNLKLEDTSVKLIKEYLPSYLKGELEGVPQEEDKVVLARNISKEEEMVHFDNEDVHQIYNHIRALIDWPIAYGKIDGKRVKFYRVSKEEKEMQETPGTVLGFVKDHMDIACKGGILKVYELQAEGKSKMDAKAFSNGLGKSLIGKRFE